MLCNLLSMTGGVAGAILGMVPYMPHGLYALFVTGTHCIIDYCTRYNRAT